MCLCFFRMSSFVYFSVITFSFKFYVCNLVLHDALPISLVRFFDPEGALPPRRQEGDGVRACRAARLGASRRDFLSDRRRDRKSTRLNSSHLVISYAVFCFKKIIM